VCVCVCVWLQPEGDSALHKKRTVVVKEVIAKRLKQAEVVAYKS